MKQVINVGSSANDGTGDTLRASQQKANSNFTELYDRGLQEVTDVNATTSNPIVSINGGKGVSIGEEGVKIATVTETIIATIRNDNQTSSRDIQLSDKDGFLAIVATADNFSNDTTASAGGIAIGQYYHTAGVVKIRLT